MRRRFALAAALPAFVSLAAMALLADRLARRALEDELGARLVVVAQAAAAELPAERVVALAPGDEGTRTYGHVCNRLRALSRATGTRLAAVRFDRSAIADSEGAHAIGQPLPTLESDRFELEQVAAGRAVPSQLLFEGTDGQFYKSGYAPLTDASGRVVAAVAAEGTAPSFTTLRRFRRLLVLIAVAGAVLGAAVSAVAAVSLTRPLRDLATAARRIGAGDLETALAPVASRGELETLRATLEEMRLALRERDRERDTMLAGIAHEVRNPLGAIELFAGALAQDVAGRPEASHVARIRGELDGLRQLVEDFLDYARARPLAVEELDAALLAAEVGELALPLARARGVELVQEGGGLLSADRHALRRAALNLTRNAIEASPPGGRVELSARVERGRLLLEVRDRGPGLSAQAREHLFEPFHTTKEGGTGLGLALARKVALAHGGTLELLEREGGGVVARLALPDAPRAPGLQPEGESAYNRGRVA